MQNKIQPRGDKVLILPDPKEEKTAAGIIIPETSQKKVNRGTVAAVSKDIESDLKEGEKVLFSPNAGTPITIEGNEYLLMSEDSVWAKL